MIQRAGTLEYDYLFLIDSDLILHPDTLKHLISTDKDIISEVFWTQWQPGTLHQPQVWMHDEYNQWELLPGEQLKPEEINRRFHEFLAKLKEPGIYEVGGLGACTLISRKAILTGASYHQVKNISYWGEDRHFCIRAAALGIPLFVDTHYPALHLYRDSDLGKVADFIKQNGGGQHASGLSEPLPQLNAAALESEQPQLASESVAATDSAQPELSLEAVTDTDAAPSALTPDAAAATDSAQPEHEAVADTTPAQPSPVPDTANEITAGTASALTRPKLTLTMVVKKEGGRFLRQVLEEHRKYIDAAVIVDDSSTDDTAAICLEVLEGIPVQLVRNTRSKFSNEIELRKQQWEAVIATEPEWILNLDSDELFEASFATEIDDLLRDPQVDLFCFRLYDFWNDSHYREDAYWRSHLSYRPFLLRYRGDFDYVWYELPQHCGRLPENIFELPHQLSNLRLKHLGWSKPEYRLEKYLRYMQLDPDGQYGWKEQYDSILDEFPRLVAWVE
ncbi:hypothetical protein B9T62_33555 [Paenibacillus donghaensis]|uniref:Glycosyl transferase n=2 Tax=Paenibacillus donghaensis TaxID=414771 RepID=A0A2Z2KXX5_9BACL|nr:hypothetical protein B9T62_33555 [Paenibacillus donghaensis]